MTVYDFLFPGDTAEDACDSVANLFNVAVNPENVNTEVEDVPSELLILCTCKQVIL